MILFIIRLILICVGLILVYKSYSIKNNKQEEIKKQQQELKIINQTLDNKREITRSQSNQIQQQLQKTKQLQNEYNLLQKEIEKEIFDKRQSLNKFYEDLENQASQAYNMYQLTLENAYSSLEKKYNQDIKELENMRESVQADLDQIKSVYQAAAAAKIKQNQSKQEQLNYMIQISDKEKEDISLLEEFKSNLHNPTIVSKVIWSTYIMKPTTDMCNRILGTNTVCGIYKITNIKSEEMYIGQSVNVADRWKTHIKYGLGIDASSTNKFYNNMQNTGVWNFTFQLLQKCTRDKLNEKEKFWIEMYQSNKIGLNGTKGGS